MSGGDALEPRIPILAVCRIAPSVTITLFIGGERVHGLAMVGFAIRLFVPSPGPNAGFLLSQRDFPVVRTAGKAAVIKRKLLILLFIGIDGGHGQPLVLTIGAFALSAFFEEKLTQRQ